MLICHIFLESEKSNREKYRFQATVIFIPQLSQYSNVAVPTKKKKKSNNCLELPHTYIIIVEYLWVKNAVYNNFFF
jgi:hypothetical protein